jgi:hypothetical protein
MRNYYSTVSPLPDEALATVLEHLFSLIIHQLARSVNPFLFTTVNAAHLQKHLPQQHRQDAV